MTSKTTIMAAALGGLLFSARADLTHRYTFVGNVNDVVGSQSGSPTVDGTYTEAPQFVADIPAGGQLASSMEVGMNYGSKKSGFLLDKSVMPNQGSISLWVKPDSLATGNYILNFPGGLFLATLNGNSIGLSDGTFNWKTGAASAGAWSHVVATWDNTADTIEYYLNGALVSSTALKTDVTSGNTLRVGGYNMDLDANNLNNQFDGKLYDLQIYDQVLGAADVTQLQSNPGSVIPEPATLGLIASMAGAMLFVRRLM